MTDARTEGLAVFNDLLPGLIPDDLTSMRDEGFAGELGDLSLDHVFGALWTRPGLDRRSRSLITLGALIALRAGEELKFHFPIAVRNGVTVEELEEVVYHLTGYVGFPAATLARTSDERYCPRLTPREAGIERTEHPTRFGQAFPHYDQALGRLDVTFRLTTLFPRRLGFGDFPLHRFDVAAQQFREQLGLNSFGASRYRKNIGSQWFVIRVPGCHAHSPGKAQGIRHRIADPAVDNGFPEHTGAWHRHPLTGSSLVLQ
jgi:4-carboxymuconolactone decarboxylase